MMEGFLPTIPVSQRWESIRALTGDSFKSHRQVLILGCGEFAMTCWHLLSQNPEMLGRLIGFVDQIGKGLINQPVVGNIADLPDLVERYKVGMIVVCLDDLRATLPVNLLLNLKVAGIEVVDGHRLFEKVTGRLSIDSLRPSALIFSAGFNRRAANMWLKRMLDLGIASMGLLVTAPLVVAAACLIKLDSPGPVIYRQLRIGLNAQPFMIMKLRSMAHDAEVSGPRWAEEEDSRISRVGRWLRKWRIDEIPQFFNVLRGEMSVVGPRPERPVFVQELRKEIPYYDIRHTVKPGITGWAQVMLGYAASKEDSHLKLQYDLYYVKNLCLGLDLKAMAKTIRVLVLGKGAR